MTQQVFTDGGLMDEPRKHYEDNKSVYLYIQDRLEGVNQIYRSLPRLDRIRLLFDSASYALMTAQAPLERADMAFERYAEADTLDADELAELFQDAGLNYCQSKAQYIADNAGDPEPFYLADRAILRGDPFRAQSHLMDVRGLGPAKSAFTLAMLGETDVACIDANVCNYFDIDKRAYDKHSADQYQQLVDDVFAEVSSIVDEASVFLAQWLIFDLQRGSIELHDGWFEHIIKTYK